MEELKVKFQEQIESLKMRYIEYGVDGWTIREIVKYVLMCVYTLAKAVETIDVVDEDKKRFVVEVVTDIYRSEEVDVPWIMEPFETMLETLILDEVIPAAVDILVGAVKKEF